MKLAEMSWPQVKAVAAKTVAVLPLGSTEQHGPHLAVSTDMAIADRVAQAMEKKLSREVVLCPSLAFGSSHHHLEYPGTLSLAADTYTRVVVELVQSLVQGGFRRIVLLNGHGGNITPVKQALSLLSHQYDDAVRPNIALATYWEMAGKVFAGEAPMKTPALSHACEYETSLMLHLFPERVDLKKARRARAPKANAWVGWEEDVAYRGVSMVKRTHILSDNGGSGEPGLATEAKGKHLFGKAVDATAAFVSDFKKWPLMKDQR
jgi:creatinine amidohydrolase